MGNKRSDIAELLQKGETISRHTQPRKHHLQNIAEREHVSMEWLVNGYGDEPSMKKEPIEQTKRTKKQRIDDSDSIIMRAWDSLTSSEQEILSNLLIRKGGRTTNRFA